MNGNQVSLFTGHSSVATVSPDSVPENVWRVTPYVWTLRNSLRWHFIDVRARLDYVTILARMSLRRVTKPRYKEVYFLTRIYGGHISP